MLIIGGINFLKTTLKWIYECQKQIRQCNISDNSEKCTSTFLFVKFSYSHFVKMKLLLSISVV